MGKIDILTKDYMSDPKHFADAFNYYMFGGKQVIQEDSLTELDPTEISIIVTDKGMKMTQKFRDLLKQCILMENDLATYMVLGMENQTDIHYAMVVQVMIYDALRYGRQVSQRAKLHRRLKDTRGDEFLSGFAKDDRLKPIITLTIYFGADDWDAPRCLHDMFETKNSKILRYVNDYKLNLIVPKEIEDFSLFTSELRQVLRFIAQSKDEESVRRIQNDKDYESVQVDTVRLINACTNTKIPIPNGAKEVNMCKGMQDYGMSCKMEGREEGRKEGRMEGRKEGREEGRMEGRSELIENMLKKGKTSAQIAEFTGISQVEIKAVEESLDNL